MIRKHMGRVLRSFHRVDRRLLEREPAMQPCWLSSVCTAGIPPMDWEEIPMGH